MTDSLILSQTSMEQFLGLYNYWIVIFLMMTGFYIVIARENLIKTIIGLNIFQTSVFLLYITMGKVHHGTAPILKETSDAGHETKEHVLRGVQSADFFEQVTDAKSLNGFEPVDSNLTQSDSSALLDELLDAVDADAAIGQVATVGFEEEVANQAVAAAAHGSEIIYSNPLPSVLMLTAIVVGIATTALALALVVRIREDYGTIEEDEILEMDGNA